MKKLLIIGIAFLGLTLSAFELYGFKLGAKPPKRDGMVKQGDMYYYLPTEGQTFQQAILHAGGMYHTVTAISLSYRFSNYSSKAHLIMARAFATVAGGDIVDANGIYIVNGKNCWLAVIDKPEDNGVKVIIFKKGNYNAN